MKNAYLTATPQGVWLSILTIFLAMGSPAIVSAGDEIVVGNFEAGDMEGWKEKVFHDKTHYELIENGGKTTLKADSQKSASGLFREIRIDLTKTPCLVWSWKVDNVLKGLDEKKKAGDDYPARVYVVFSGGAMFWKTRALNYVWSGGQPTDSAWPNAYTGSSINLAVQSGAAKVGQWVQQQRNIREDYKHLIGEDVTQADAIAIMTDTDDSGGAATAYYGQISLTSSCS